VAKVGTSNHDRTISLKAAVRSCINKHGSGLDADGLELDPIERFCMKKKH
jgi:hypothetical protein